jgi:hypothetical protein
MCLFSVSEFCVDSEMNSKSAAHEESARDKPMKRPLKDLTSQEKGKYSL